jgi:uncharacterized protein with HEPN domain
LVDERLYLERIVKQCNKINRYLKITNATKETFVKDELAFDATVPCLIQIGEAVNRLGKDIEVKYPHIKWHQIRGLRNRITHDYEGVGEQAIWFTLTKNVPDLKRDIEEILLKLPTEKDN